MKWIKGLLLLTVGLALSACGQVSVNSLDEPIRGLSDLVFENQRLRRSISGGTYHYGDAVSVSGDVAIIGAPYSDGPEADPRAAFIFRKTASSWIEEAKLLPSDGRGYGLFGGTVAIDGDLAVVGRKGRYIGFSEKIYVYRFTSEGWVEEARLKAADSEGGDHFGSSLSIDDDMIVVGAPGYASGTQAAYIFRRTVSGWLEEAKLTPSDGTEHFAFGSSVGVDSGTVVIGSGTYSSPDLGAAYVFRQSSTGWVEEAKLTPSDGLATYSNFARLVSIDNDLIVASARPVDEDTQGLLYIFRNTW